MYNQQYPNYNDQPYGGASYQMAGPANPSGYSNPNYNNPPMNLHHGGQLNEG